MPPVSFKSATDTATGTRTTGSGAAMAQALFADHVRVPAGCSRLILALYCAGVSPSDCAHNPSFLSLAEFSYSVRRSLLPSYSAPPCLCYAHHHIRRHVTKTKGQKTTPTAMVYSRSMFIRESHGDHCRESEHSRPRLSHYERHGVTMLTILDTACPASIYFTCANTKCFHSVHTVF